MCVSMRVFTAYFFWTSSSLDGPAGVTKEEGRTGFLIHLPSAVHAFIFLARGIQPFLSLVDGEVNFVYIYICMYVCICMVITYSRVWINRVRLPILLARGQLNRENKYSPVSVRA